MISSYVILLILACLQHYFIYLTASPSLDNCELFIAPSRFLENGMGIFAAKPQMAKKMPPGVTLYFKSNKNWQLTKYCFNPLDSEHNSHVLIFGPSMIYNHHEKPNTKHTAMDHWKDEDEYVNNVVFPQIKMFQLLQANTIYPRYYYSLLDGIHPGEEVFNNYGRSWFDMKGIVLKTPTTKETSYESVDELKKIGHCASNIYNAASLIKSEESAGQGVFASVEFKKGKFVEVSPVLVHPKHEVIENSDQISVLINFCFSQPGSDVSLLPLGYAAVCNHGGKKQANVAIEWYVWDANNTNITPTQNPEYLIKSDFAELYFAYRALRDIKKDEEILIDYGDDWEADWNKYLQQKRDFINFQGTVPLFRRAINLPAHMFPKHWNVDCIGTSCATMTEEQKKNPTYKRYKHPEFQVPVPTPRNYTSSILTQIVTWGVMIIAFFLFRYISTTNTNATIIKD